MSENKPTQTGNTDPLASLHRMSTTAGVAAQEYVAINLTAVAALVLGLASALAVVSNVLLLFPLAAIVVGIIAMRQVSHSNGTQTGRGLALVGILAAVAMVAVFGAREYRDWSMQETEKQLVNQVVAQLEKKILAKDYSGIITLFGDGFLERKKITAKQFATVWDAWCAKTPYGAVKSVKTNDRLLVSPPAADGTREGGTMLLIQFDKEPMPARLDLALQKKDGNWRILDVPKMFPAPAPEAPPPPPGLTGPAM